MIWKTILVLLGMVGLIIGVIVSFTAFSLIVLRLVSLVLPLAGRRTRKKGRQPT